jgi:hypothetical protein
MLATQPKTFDKRDRAVKAALAALGADAKEGADFGLERILTVSGQKTVTRYQWTKFNTPAYLPKVKDRVHNIHDHVDGVLRPDVHGTVLVVGPTVSEVKWDKPAPWGQLQNCLNQHLQPVDNGIPGFLKVENRKPLAPEKKAALDKRMEEAKVIKPAAESEHDFTLPKNIEPAGLEILAARNKVTDKASKTVSSPKPTVVHEKTAFSKIELLPTDKIQLLVKENPHREGSGRWKRWSLYKDGMTVQAALEAGLNKNNLRYRILDSHIKIGSGK